MTLPAPHFTPPSERRNGSGAVAQHVKRTKPLKPWHEAIIDDLLIHPLDDLKVRAKRLNYSVAYLSLIINSDMFKAVYAQRRADFQSRLADGLALKMAGVATKQLDIMSEQLDLKRTSIPFRDLSEANSKLLDRLGYGSKPDGGVNVNVNASGQTVVAVSATPQQLEESRALIRAVQQNNALASPPRALPEARGTEPEMKDVTPRPNTTE
jgi:hypothetical protein